MIIIRHEELLYKVNWQYYRNEGVTICRVRVTDDVPDSPGITLEGVARCNPRDTFDKKAGRKLSLTRAIECLPKAARTAIWEKYWMITVVQPTIERGAQLLEAFRRDPVFA